MVNYSGNLIPNMTSDTYTFNGVTYVASSSGNYNSNFPSYSAFNGDKTSQSLKNDWVGLSTTFPQWLMIDLGLAKAVSKYNVTGAIYNSLPATTTGSPKSWIFQGSNDASKWMDLDVQSNQSNWSFGETREFEINNSIEYRYYRIYINSHNGSPYGAVIGELELFESSYSNKFLILSSDRKVISHENDGVNGIVKYIPNNSEQNFINHGLDKSAQIDLNAPMTNKVLIEQSSTPLGEGKVFKKSIDISQMVIKKVEVK